MEKLENQELLFKEEFTIKIPFRLRITAWLLYLSTLFIPMALGAGCVIGAKELTELAFRATAGEIDAASLFSLDVIWQLVVMVVIGLVIYRVGSGLGLVWPLMVTLLLTGTIIITWTLCSATTPGEMFYTSTLMLYLLAAYVSSWWKDFAPQWNRRLIENYLNKHIEKNLDEIISAHLAKQVADLSERGDQHEE